MLGVFEKKQGYFEGRCYTDVITVYEICQSASSEMVSQDNLQFSNQ